MFEAVVATILNKYLGKYIQDLDIENLNVGIFGGDVQLSDLKLRPEALYELDLPIEVKVGTIGKISLNIPWTGLYTQSVVVNLEDVYIIAGPVTGRPFDPEKEKRLDRASKRKKLEDLEGENVIGAGPPDSKNFAENLVTTIINNLQIFVSNIHIRYEDAVTNVDSPMACGICIQNISVETTNNKWKPALTAQGATTLYQLIRVESFSVYWNPNCGADGLVADWDGLGSAAPYWWNEMRKGIEKFSINQKDFDFIVKPITAKVKVIMNKSNEARVPKLLVDFVLQDAATQLSRQQYLSIVALRESFQRIRINRDFRQYHPAVGVDGNISKWWKYAFTAVLAQRVHPYSWQHIKKHRENYRSYKETYKKTLLSPNDTELKLDCHKLEDHIAIIDIVIAREHAKIELRREEPARVAVHEPEADWWGLFHADRRVALEVHSERGRGLWAQMSPAEKKQLCDTIGYVEGVKRPEKPKQYTEHKVNITLANCSVSLVNRRREILVATLTQFLGSIETRPSAHAFKVSARAESFLVEGCSVENDLIPMLTADNMHGTTNTNFLAVDFEKNPLNSEADFGLAIGMEPFEIVYHEHAVSEIINFFQTKSMALKEVLDYSRKHLTEAAEVGRSLVRYTVGRHKTFNINMDLKGPYFVIPEHGSVQKGGSVLVLDLGRVVVRSDLQPAGAALEDATQMELEERLYDRLHLDFSDFQLLFCDSGEEWRDARKRQDTEHHLVPKIRCQIVFSNSIKPDYRPLPRHKLTISVSSIKLNVSERKLCLVLDFLEQLPLPRPNTVRVSDAMEAIEVAEHEADRFMSDSIPAPLCAGQLARVRCLIALAEMARERHASPSFDREAAKGALLQVDKSFMSSDHSDEENELWARTVDLPGFDDNVSPRNVIKMLLRFVIGEVVVQLSRSSTHGDKGYLQLRVSKLCWDTALMEYGPAVQASVGAIHLVDKIHTGPAGEYLEMLSTDAVEDFATLLYRKVRSDCPDFKSHFHSVEQSLVVDFTSLAIVFHRDAFSTLNKYLCYLLHKMQSRETYVRPTLPNVGKLATWLLSTGDDDPPIPAGATKFSYSTRMAEIRVKMCDTDIDFLDVKLAGFESDCLFKANERMVLRVYLTSMAIDDLSDMTLYPKIVSIEDDKVLELKYVRHSPKLYTQSNVDSTQDDVKSDGSFRLHIGRVHVVVLYKMLVDLQRFLEPFLPHGAVTQMVHWTEKEVEKQVAQLRGWTTKLHLSLDIHAPTLLLPQKSASPNLIIFNMGDLSVENFFKEVNPSMTGSTPGEAVPVIDNVLVRLDALQVSRAIMTLAGTLEIQEPMLEPARLRLDVRRTLWSGTACTAPSTGTPLPLYDADAALDAVRINLGQRDLATLLAVCADNLAEGHFSAEIRAQSPTFPPLEPVASPSMNPTEEAAVRKLAAFFSHNEHARRQSSLRLSFDGLQLYLFTDIDEVLSSPVRDLNHGLCKLHVGEASVSLETLTDNSFELKASLQCIFLEDIRPDNTIIIKRIFQSHGDEMEAGPISVSTPPIVDLTLRQSAGGDRNLNILVERTRLNLSVPFFVGLGRFLLDSLPGERPGDGGLVNHGYVGDHPTQMKADGGRALRPPSSADSTSGYFSSGASYVDDSAGLSVSIQLRKPEIMLFADLSQRSTHALLLQTEFLVDYSRHPGRENLVCSFSGLQILSKLQGSNRQPAHLVLHPCDIEFAKSLRSVEEGIRVTAGVSKVDVHLSASVVHTVCNVIDDINTSLLAEEGDGTTKLFQVLTEMEDLWSPKKIQPYILPDVSDNVAYCSSSDAEGRLSETLTLAVPKIRVVFEMEDGVARIPLLVVKSSIEASVQDWSRQMHMKAEMQVQASYYNESVAVWEPLIEPVVEQENVYRPWEFLIKVFQAKAFPLSSRLGQERVAETERNVIRPERSATLPKSAGENSDTSADEAETENGMTFIRRHNNDMSQAAKRSAHNENVSMVGYPDDSDSESEEGVMEKLASAMSHLFTGDSSDGEASESEESSGAEPSVETEEASEMTLSCAGSTIVGRDDRAVFLKKHDESVDSGLEPDTADRWAMYVLVDARDRLELTLTPAATRVLHDLALAFSRTAAPGAMQCLDAPLTLANDLGPGAAVTLTSKAAQGPDGRDLVLMFATYDKADSAPSSPASTTAGGLDASPNESDVDMESFEGGFSTSNTIASSGQELSSPVLTFPGETVTKLYKKITDERLNIDVEGFDSLHVLAPQRVVSKLHLLQPIKNNTRYYIVVNVDIRQGHRKISVRSPLQIKNDTSYAMGLYYKKPVLASLGVEQIGESINPFEDTIRVAVIEPDEVFNVPLYVAYHCKLHILPAYVDSYNVSETGLWWQELATDLHTPRDVSCAAKEPHDPTVFACRAVCTEGAQIASRAPSRSVPNYLIRLLPPLAVHNRLPYAVEIKIPSIKYEVRVEAGEKANVYFLDLLKMHKISIEVPAYLGIPWTGSFSLTADLEEKMVAMATEHDTEGGNKQLGLNLSVSRSGTCDVFLHAPYWIINKTGLPLQVRGSSSDIIYEAQSEEPLLFCYKKHRRRCVRLRAYHSSWSSAFSLDAAGCAGLVVCADRERRRRYRILLTTALSRLSPQLTRIVTLLPNFLVTNECRKHIRVMEENERADMWIDLAPGQCIPFWPETDSMKMFVKYRDSKLVSQHFPITHNHQTVLRMDKGGGLCVSVTGGGDQPFSIAVRAYSGGDAPVRVDNLCEDLFLKVYQQDCGQVALLSPCQSVLCTWDDNGGLCVSVTGGGDQPFSIAVRAYSGGDAPVRVDNLCEDLFLKVYQQDCGQVALLSPCQSVLCTWDDPTRDRALLWNVYNSKAKGYLAQFAKDGFGQERVSFHTVKQSNANAATPTSVPAASAKLAAGLKRIASSKTSPVPDGSSSSDDSECDEQKPQAKKTWRRDKVLVYWVSFLERHQRVLLFTQDERIAHQMRGRIDAERSAVELFLSMRGVGVSVAVDSRLGQNELAYLTVSDSSAVWEVMVAHRWKLLPLELASWVEDKWKQDQKKAQMKDYVHVDFDKMHMTKPFYGELRRRHYPGLWLQYRKSEHQTYLHCKVNRLQIDNQLHDAVFPTVLYPSPAPVQAVRRAGAKPCLELALMKRHRPHYNQDIYKFINLLVQEFSIQLDKGFLLSMYGVWSQWHEDEKPSLRIRSDIALLHSPISLIAAKAPISTSQQVLIEYMHLSPVQLQLSFSPRGTVHARTKVDSFQSDLVDCFLNSFGATLAEVKGVRLKLACLEQQDRRVSLARQWREVRAHFLGQLVQQFHVLVLGRDVLGTPYGPGADSVDSASSAADFFYEPCLGVMDGPEEFSEGLSYAAQSLLGHLVGGTAGSVSLLSASLGNLISSLSFDEDYKKKRRFCLQQASDLPETLLAAGKTFSMGVALGLSGVIMKPILGAHQEGVEGFFKGVGKGLMGLMTKPNGGVIDCVGMAADGIKRAAELGEDVVMRGRLPRHLCPCTGVKPYSVHAAIGMQLLSALAKGHYADTDFYWAHAALATDARAVLLITLQHVFLVRSCRVWAAWDIEWAVRVDDIMAVPSVVGDKLVVKVRQDESLNLFSGDERSVECQDAAVLEWLRKKIETVLILNMEDKPCPGEL